MLYVACLIACTVGTTHAVRDQWTRVSNRGLKSFHSQKSKILTYFKTLHCNQLLWLSVVSLVRSAFHKIKQLIVLRGSTRHTLQLYTTSHDYFAFLEIHCNVVLLSKRKEPFIILCYSTGAFKRPLEQALKG